MLEIKIEPGSRYNHSETVIKKVETLSEFTNINFQDIEEIGDYIFDISNYIYAVSGEMGNDGDYKKIETFKELEDNIITAVKELFSENKTASLSDLVYKATLLELKRYVGVVEEYDSEEEYKKKEIEELVNSSYMLNVLSGIGSSIELSKEFERIVKRDFDNNLEIETYECVETGKYNYIDPIISISVIIN